MAVHAPHEVLPPELSTTLSQILLRETLLPFLSGRSKQIQASLPVDFFLIQVTQLFLPPEQSFQFLFLLSKLWSFLHLKGTLANYFIYLKIIILHPEKWAQSENSSTGTTENYLSATKVMWTGACSCVSKQTSLRGIHAEVSGDLWTGSSSALSSQSALCWAP